MANLEKNQKSSLFIIVMAVICQVLWGIVFPFVKIAYGSFGIDNVGSTLQFAGIRFTCAGLILLAITVIKEKSLPRFTGKQMLSLLALGTIQTGLVYAFQFVAMLTIPSINCSIINGLNPAFSIIVAHFMFTDDKLNGRKMIGVVLGIAGVLFCFLYGYTASSISFMGEGLMFISMLIFVFGSNYSRIVTRTVSPVAASGFNLLIGGLELLVLSLLLGGRIGRGTAEGWGILAYLVFTSSVSLYLWTMLGHVAGVGRIAVFMSVNPVAGALSAALVAGENILQLKYIVAIALIVLGIIVINTKNRKTLKDS